MGDFQRNQANVVATDIIRTTESATACQPESSLQQNELASIPHSNLSNRGLTHNSKASFPKSTRLARCSEVVNRKPREILGKAGKNTAERKITTQQKLDPTNPQNPASPSIFEPQSAIRVPLRFKLSISPRALSNLRRTVHAMNQIESSGQMVGHTSPPLSCLHARLPSLFHV